MKIRTPSDRQEFNVVWQGRHYRLASLREHVRAKDYPAGSHYLLLFWIASPVPHWPPRAKFFCPHTPDKQTPLLDV
jgi:hypothetical protein